MKKFLIVLAMVVTASLLMGAGCLVNTPPVITTLALPDATVGTAYTATVEATDADGDALTFSLVSGPTDMVMSEAGVISGWTPAEVGTEDVTVAVTDGEDPVSADFTITVVEPPSVNQAPVIDSGPITVAIVGVVYAYDVNATDPDGDTLTYSLTTYPSNMVIDSATGVISWVPISAQVGDNNVVVEVSDGALSDTQAFTITVTAVEPELELTGIVVEPKTMTLFAGGSEAIESVTATFEIRGYEIFIILGECTFVSSDIEVATVSDVGLVEAVAEGTATITVSYEGETDTVEVTVNPVLLTSIVVLPETMTLLVGESETITSVTADYDDGSTASIALGDCTYASSAATVATVSNGLVSAVVEGTATVTVSYEGETDTLEVTVSEPEPEPVVELDHIVVLPEAMPLFVGGSETITSVTAHYDDGSTAVVALGDCTYASSATEFATVSNGVVTAVAEGVATITVSYGGETDTIEVTVNPVLLTSIVVLPEVMELSVRGSETITSVTAHYDDGSTAVIALGDCTYLSDDEEVATVLVGVVSGVEVGVATITATYESMTDTVEVTVKSIRLTSIVVDPKDMTLIGIGETEDIESVTAHYSDGTEDDEIDLADCVFTSDDEDVATVSDAGVVTAVDYGEATITVTYTEEEITKAVLIEETDTIEVKVIDKVNNIDANRYYPTIEAAIIEARTDETIEVAAGTYIPDDTLIIDVESLTLRSIAGPTTTIIDFEDLWVEPCIYIGASYVTIEGFTLKHSHTDPMNGIYLSGFGTMNNVTVTGNILHNATIYLGGDGSDLSNSIIADNTFPDKGGINFDGNINNVTITGNNISSANIQFDVHNYDNILITENTISKNPYLDGGIRIQGVITNLTITHNNITENENGGITIGYGKGIPTSCTWGAGNVINNNNIVDNVGYGIEVEVDTVFSNGNVVDAENNWWGDASGPEHHLNPGATGDIVGDEVDYIPWSTVEN